MSEVERLNASIAQSRIEELEDVQISLEQENNHFRIELTAWQQVWSAIHEHVPSELREDIELSFNRQDRELPTGWEWPEED
tara:strand:- start:401 stop:643 length:243 start_codon:yes stop_codon:yes gene_type:complete